MRRILLLTALALSCTLLLAGCPGVSSPDTEKKVQETMKVPGMEEQLKAVDMAVKSAIIISWKSDPELAQEQLAVEDVHNGKVRITGIVSRKELKERAEKIAKDQEHVFDVISTITVDESLKDKRLSLDDM